MSRLLSFLRLVSWDPCGSISMSFSDVFGGPKLAFWSGVYCTPIHRQDLGLRRNCGEGRAVGPGHPGLGLEVQNLAEKCLSASLVEMGRDLVEQDERGCAGKRSDQLGFRQNETEQERLLLAGGAVAGRCIVGAVKHY